MASAENHFTKSHRMEHEEDEENAALFETIEEDIQPSSVHNEAEESVPQERGSPEEQDRRDSHFSWRAIAGGIVIGGIMCFSNMYFGLQTGWVTMGSLQSSVLGYGLFHLLSKCTKFGQNFTPIENVLLQTTGVACATMPLAGGFVGIIPALEQMDENEGGPLKLSLGQQFLWAMALAFFGVFFAVPLRTQTILREKLRFPSAVATAAMIRILHRLPSQDDSGESSTQYSISSGTSQRTDGDATKSEGDQAERDSANSDQQLLDHSDSHVGKEDDGGPTFSQEEAALRREWNWKWMVLAVTFLGAGTITLCMHFLPAIENLKVFSWVGFQAATSFQWTITPSGGYLGQGMIMGSRTVLSMLLGSIVGWAILGPISKSRGWAPGDINSWENGAKGFITWISLAVMLADSLTGLSIISYRVVMTSYKASNVSICPLTGDKRPLLDDNTCSGQFHRGSIGRRSTSTNYLDSAENQEETRETSVETQSVRNRFSRDNTVASYDGPPEPLVVDPAPEHHQVPRWWWVAGLVLSTGLCVAIVSPVFNMKVYEPLVAVILALIVAVLAVRALGETDLNPVSGVGKLSQAVFAGISPGNVLSNLLAGAIAEAGMCSPRHQMARVLGVQVLTACAGAQQAGDMMQDLKTGHLLKASPRAQFLAQVRMTVVIGRVSLPQSIRPSYSAHWVPDFRLFHVSCLLALHNSIHYTRSHISSTDRYVHNTLLIYEVTHNFLVVRCSCHLVGHGPHCKRSWSSS
eukprot:gb/GECG01010557.1/.p1 GENE.gb/GECG01010557.1/~~gb/GECG01010557.1/.p1  ORF type:complete len:748 (+),score=55.69 gb/GECG01010557.1/:1-2244(+)